MILIDYSQLTIVTLMGWLKGDTETHIEIGAFRSLVLNAILEVRRKYHKRFGEVVICADGNDYWRREILPYYKGTRKKTKEESGYDWKRIKECQQTLLLELKRFFPYPVIETPKAEADDSIAILVEWSQNFDLDEDGLFNTPKDCLIVSADEDFLQLQKYKNVKQFSLQSRKVLTPEIPLKQFCLEHVLAGDASDAIPNILSPLNFFQMKDSSVEPMRQKPCTANIKKFYYDQVLEHGEVIDFRSEDEEKRFRENEKLVLFEHIPDDVWEDVIEVYKSQLGKRRNKIFDYLTAARLPNLIKEIDDF